MVLTGPARDRSRVTSCLKSIQTSLSPRGSQEGKHLGGKRMKKWGEGKPDSWIFDPSIRTKTLFE